MAKLGYTFYPKDWQTNDIVFELSLEQRAVFREVIDLAMTNDNVIDFKYSTWSRKLGVEISKLKSIINDLKNFDLVVISDNETLFVPSCEKRLNLVRGGAKGGKKSLKDKPIPKPIPKPSIKPIPKQEEEEIEVKNKEEIKEEVVNEIDNIEIEFDKDIFKDIEELKKYYLTDLRLRNAFCKTNKFDNNKMHDRLEQFNNHLESQSRFKETFTEYAKHFLSWHRKAPDTNNQYQKKEKINAGELIKQKYGFS